MKCDTLVNKFLETGLSRDLPVVDAHIHYWDLENNFHPWLCEKPLIPFRYGDYSSICRTFMPTDYREITSEHLIVDTVYMEAEWHPEQGLEEIEWVHAVHQQYGQPVAMIAQAWLDTDNIKQYLESISNYPLVQGVRHKPATCAHEDYSEDHNIAGSMNCPDWEKGYALLGKYKLLFELQTPWWHLPDLKHLLEKYPDIKVVINHAGVPGDREKETLEGWYKNLQEISLYDNVYIKISGIGEKGHPWNLNRNGELILSVIKLFGSQRVMFASNFPVDSLCVEYSSLFKQFKEITSNFSKEERLDMFYLNSIKIYKNNQ